MSRAIFLHRKYELLTIEIEKREWYMASTCVFPVGAAVLVSLNLQNSPYGSNSCKFKVVPPSLRWKLTQCGVRIPFSFSISLKIRSFPCAGKLCNVTSKNVFLFFDTAGAAFAGIYAVCACHALLCLKNIFADKEKGKFLNEK